MKIILFFQKHTRYLFPRRNPMTPFSSSRKLLPLFILALIGLLLPQPTTPAEPSTKEDDYFVIGAVVAGCACTLAAAAVLGYYAEKSPETTCQELHEKYKETISIYTAYTKEGIAACDLDEAILEQCGLMMFPEKAPQLEEDIVLVSQALTKELDTKNYLAKDNPYEKTFEHRMLFEQTCATIVNLQELKTHLIYLQTILYAHKQYFDLHVVINDVKTAHKSELTLVDIVDRSQDFYTEHFSPLLHACIHTRYKKYPYVYYAQLIEEQGLTLQSIEAQLPYLRYKAIHNQVESLLSSLSWLFYYITHDCTYQQELEFYTKDLQHKKEVERTHLYLQEQRIEAEWERFKAKNTK